MSLSWDVRNQCKIFTFMDKLKHAAKTSNERELLLEAAEAIRMLDYYRRCALDPHMNEEYEIAMRYSTRPMDGWE